MQALLSLLKLAHDEFKPGAILEHIIHVFTKHIINLLLASLLGPLLLQPVKPLEVEGLTAHRASGFGTLVVPLLDTAKAEAVPAGEVAVGSLAVAHRALHLRIKFEELGLFGLSDSHSGPGTSSNIFFNDRSRHTCRPPSCHRHSSCTRWRQRGRGRGQL